QERLPPTVARREGLLLDDGMAVGLDAGEPFLRRPVPARGDHRALQQQALMRARADAEVIAVAPVGEVVTALGARSGVVADLVGGQAKARGLLGRGLVQAGRVVLGREDEGAARMLGGEARAGLDGELVKAEMVRREGQRLPQLGAPGLFRLAGPGV